MNRRPGSAITGYNIDKGGLASPSDRTRTVPQPRGRQDVAPTRRERPVVSTTGSMESVRSADVTSGGTIRSDPGAARVYDETASTDVCFDEKVLKQIR